MRTLPDPGFAGDDGAVSPEVVEALAAFARDPDRRQDATLRVLQDARVLVPVVAVLGEVAHDEAGRAHDKSADMATVLLQGQDGRHALLAFTGAASLHQWDPEARPVPVALPRAAEAALADGATAIVIDVAGPVLFAVETEDLRSLAAGERLVQVGDRHGWIRPD